LSAGKEPFLAAIKQNICGRCRGNDHRTLQLYPLKGYGAGEIGIHRFHHLENAENVGDAKFVMLWQNADGMWKVTRVIKLQPQPRGKSATPLPFEEWRGVGARVLEVGWITAGSEA